MRRREGDKAADLLRAAVKVFARDGFDVAKVSTIAEQAGVATGSVYLYYAGKDDLLDAVFREFWERLRDALASVRQPRPLDRIRDQLGVFYDLLWEDRDLAAIYLREHHRFLARKPAGHEAYLACMEFGEKAFVEASGHDVDPGEFSLSVAVLMGGVRSALEYALSRPEQLNDAIRNHMLLMSMAGIRVLAEGSAS